MSATEKEQFVSKLWAHRLTHFTTYPEAHLQRKRRHPEGRTRALTRSFYALSISLRVNYISRSRLGKPNKVHSWNLQDRLQCDAVFTNAANPRETYGSHFRLRSSSPATHHLQSIIQRAEVYNYRLAVKLFRRQNHTALPSFLHQNVPRCGNQFEIDHSHALERNGNRQLHNYNR